MRSLSGEAFVRSNYYAANTSEFEFFPQSVPDDCKRSIGRMAEASGGGGLEQVVGTCSQCDGSASTFLPDGVCSNCSGQPIATGTHSPAATRSHSVIGNSAIGGHGIDPASLSGAEGGDASSNKRGRIANGKDSATEERNSGGEGNGGRGKKTPGDEAGAADGETNTLPNNKELKVLASTEEAEVSIYIYVYIYMLQQLSTL